MRLNRLDLTRYGRFCDARINLPAPAEGTADVTVIYGPNEAGKSTAFTAYLELLFGMKARDHPYEFRFKRSDLLVGAELDLPGRGPVVVQRNSKKTQSLLDEHGRPVEDTLLAAALQGLSRDDYVERFSLNDDGLRKGGARIASAQGDLGQLLHAGVSGLTSMADTLEDMSARADRFHKKGGRGTELKRAKDRLAEIAQELRASGLTPARERALAQTLEKAKAEFDAADTALDQARMRDAAQKAAQVWYDKTLAIQTMTAKLQSYPDGRDLRSGASEAVARLVVTLAEQARRESEAEGKLQALQEVIKDNPPDDAAEAIENELTRLDQLTFDDGPLMARATTGALDVGKRIAERSALHDKMDACLNALSVPTAQKAALVMTAREIEDLAEAAQNVLTASRAVESTADAVESASLQQGDAPPEPQDLSALQAVWDTWQTVADVTVAQTTVATEAARFEKAVAAVPRNWSDLVKSGLPGRETLNDLVRKAPVLTADLAAAQAEFRKCETAYHTAQLKRQTDEAAPSAIDLSTTAQTRRVRQEKWLAHRAEMSPHTADDFETALHSDDDAQASYAAGADARAQLSAARRDEAEARVAYEQAQKRLETLATEQADLAARSSDLSRALGLLPDSNPVDFSERRAALVQVADLKASFDTAKAALQALSERRDSAEVDLREAATLVGIVVADKDLPAKVRAALTLQDSVRQVWRQWSQGQDNFLKLKEKAVKAVADLDNAERHLARMTAALPLAAKTVNVISRALPHLRNFQQLNSDLNKLDQRIESLENAVALLATSAQRIADLAGDPELGGNDPVAVIERARLRVAKAQNADTRRSIAQKSHAEEIGNQTAAKSAMKEAQDELAEWFEGQGGEELAPTVRVSLLVERDTLRAAISTEDQARLIARAAVDPDLFGEELAMLPDASREGAVRISLEDSQTNRETARDAYREAERLYQAAFDAADRSELATEQATIREELRQGARQAAVLRLGSLAARGALRRLAAERRTTMLRDVENAFVSMTAPKWHRVDVWTKSEGDKLVGIQPDGTAVPVEMMSTGTMGQLYFALRVAGYRSFAREFGPLPMILDDIMETFDDARAKAALQLCSDIGQSGQAIMFTHHAHLVDLAREAITGVNIVNMPR